MNILILVSSKTGNTRKVAEVIARTAETEGHLVDLQEATGSTDVRLLDYDLVFAGSGVYDRQPARQINEMVDTLMKRGVREKLVLPAAPRRPGKYAVIFCSYGGVHTGVNEAIPAVKRIGQLFDHYGIDVLDEVYVVGAFTPQSMQEYNRDGRLGDINGRPNQEDLNEVARRTHSILLDAARQAAA